jgi:hypothetical protein
MPYEPASVPAARLREAESEAKHVIEETLATQRAPECLDRDDYFRKHKGRKDCIWKEGDDPGCLALVDMDGTCVYMCEVAVIIAFGRKMA